jgi:TATA-binding protein-associated factor Taf7
MRHSPLVADHQRLVIVIKVDIDALATSDTWAVWVRNQFKDQHAPCDEREAMSGEKRRSGETEIRPMASLILSRGVEEGGVETMEQAEDIDVMATEHSRSKWKGGGGVWGLEEVLRVFGWASEEER